MQKATEYDWKDSNMALFGSDIEKNVKKESAETEPAWNGSGKKVGVEVWRINQFKVERWPKEDNGSFFDGDSYIILNTYKSPEGDTLLYDLHFWIGAHSTQDEYGTAAYKTVELDTFHDDKPIQHREVMGYESELFKSYFPEMVILKGGVASGFRKVEKVVPQPRLFHFHGDKKHIEMRQIGLKRSNLDSSDVFILDLGNTIYQWNGHTSNKDERFKATQYLQQLRSDRCGRANVEVLDGDIEEDHDFWTHLDKSSEKDTHSEFPSDLPTQLFRLSDETGGKLVFQQVNANPVTRDCFDSADVFIYAKPDHCYVWIGSGASVAERKNAFQYAHNYLSGTANPVRPVTVVKDGQEPAGFF
jgi:gelsolin